MSKPYISYRLNEEFENLLRSTMPRDPEPGAEWLLANRPLWVKVTACKEYLEGPSDYEITIELR